MPYSGGLKRNIVQCLVDFGIPLRLRTTVVDIQGKERVEGVTVAQVDEQGRPIPGTEEEVPCDTLLLSMTWWTMYLRRQPGPGKGQPPTYRAAWKRVWGRFPSGQQAVSVIRFHLPWIQDAWKRNKYCASGWEMCTGMSVWKYPQGDMYCTAAGNGY